MFFECSTRAVGGHVSDKGPRKPSQSAQPRIARACPNESKCADMGIRRLRIPVVFAKLTTRRLKRGVFRSIVDLQAAINPFLAETNAYLKPFTWTKDPNKNIAAVKRGHQVLNSIH